MTRAAFTRRVARMEAANAPPVMAYRPTVEVGMFETIDEAVARHRATHGKAPRGIGLFIVPAKPRGAVEEAEWKRRFKEQQLRLIGDARRERLADDRHVEIRQTLPMKQVALPRFPAVIRWRPLL